MYSPISRISETNMHRNDTPPPEFWNIFLSKKTHKMLKYLNIVPDITWRSPLHPEVQTSSSEIAPNHPSEKRKASLKKRVRKPAQPEKRDETSPVTIRGFIVKAQEDVESKKKSQETKTDELFGLKHVMSSQLEVMRMISQIGKEGMTANIN
uniref:Uncharacterized protein n=1 Tax=Ananas comosus var. bracteatus TaxID=296719 RepID=A0A6V7NHJ3_ANACO|nr:unnamed protein product [Ananas comosus var. bracteatus]